jgi:hypothetical protein
MRSQCGSGTVANSESDPYPVPGPVLATKHCKMFQKKKSIFFIKNCNLFISRPPRRTSKLHEKPSAYKRKHPPLLNMKFSHFFHFCGSFLPNWNLIRIQPTKINADVCGGSTTLSGPILFVADPPENPSYECQLIL